MKSNSLYKYLSVHLMEFKRTISSTTLHLEPYNNLVLSLLPSLALDA